jgi:hypothetical protein
MVIVCQWIDLAVIVVVCWTISMKALPGFLVPANGQIDFVLVTVIFTSISLPKAMAGPGYPS